MDETQPQVEMPKYKCHKEVHALKIAGLSTLPSGALLVDPEDDGFGTFEVSAEYVKKHQPEAGGYYVVYKGGHKSFSPAEAFEGGYTPAS